ncbi:MAG: hypothetical protein M1825_001260 [Sarcosagium campestre]|nr:MAG: hypothetical protein M1825_001260 [Sarcosagium campestre]
MFKKEFNAGAKTKVKSSVQRGIRSKVVETYPALSSVLDDIIPKKSQLDIVKLPDRVSLYTLNGHPLFFQHMDDALLPTLRLVHQYPSCFRRVRVDRGAIPHVLAGASLMAPGLTSQGGRLPPAEEELREGDVVVVEAEGKREACLVGVLSMGTEEMKVKKKGAAVENGHFVGDGLWKLRLD